MKKEYPEGIRFFPKHEKAPEFVLANVSVDKMKFTAWLAQQTPNEKGYLKFQLLQGKEAPYLVLDNYKPTGSIAKEEPAEDIKIQDIPF